LCCLRLCVNNSCDHLNDALRIAEPHSNALLGSFLSLQIFLLPSAAIECLSVFGARMHPEKDAATLNKCKPQRV